MKKSILISLILLALFVQNASSQQLGSLYTERTGGFTMSMPQGWQTADFNQKYLMIMGPEVNGLTPNIGFGDEEYAGTISSFTDQYLSYLPLLFSDFNQVSRGRFTTNAGVNGECVTYLVTMGSIRVRQKIYVFPNRRGTAVMVIACTAPVAGGDRYDAIFDASVKTFVWTK